MYGRRLGALEEQLQALRGKQRIKLEELKQKSDYYRTIKLIERFDASSNTNGKKTTTPKKEATATPPATSIERKLSNAAVNIQQQLQHHQHQKVVEVQSRGWVDRWTDYLLGEEDAALRYALICSKCHAHNGLSLVPIVPFSCRNCHYLNNEPNPGGGEAMDEKMRKNLLKSVMGDADATPIAEHPKLKKNK